MKTFLFYDLETSGLNPAFDQVLTFACIRTDTSLREIDRTSLTIQLRKDIIPSPHAFVTHCLTPRALSCGMREYEAALYLHTLFNTPDTLSLGYNSLTFDDEFLRFLFYRNLLDPYSHQYAKGCSRADILPVTALFKIFCEPVITWPRLENGRSSLKLELICRDNQFATSGRAHEAMADVEALVALCRAFFTHADIWDYALGFFDKHTDLSRIHAIPETCRIGDRLFRTAIMISSSFGPDAGYMAPVLHIGESIPYRNQQLWIPLNRPEFLKIDPDTNVYDWIPIRKKPADQWIVLPCLDRFRERLSPVSQDAAKDMITVFRTDPQRFFATIDVHKTFAYPVIPDIDPDASLYQEGFFSAGEKKQMARFHDAGPFHDMTPGAARAVLETLQSPRIKTLGTRILARNFNLVGDPQFNAHLESVKTGNNRIKGYKNDEKYTLPLALAHAADLGAGRTPIGLDARQQEALVRVTAYLESLAPSLSGPAMH